MNKIWLFFSKLIPRNRKSLTVFGVCLLTSSIFWVFLTFNRTYQSEIDFKVVYNDFPDNKLLLNHPVEELRLKVKAKGFELFRYTAFDQQPILNLHFRDFSLVKRGSVSTYSMGLNSNVKALLGKQKTDFTILSFSKDTLKLQYDDLFVKKLPVRKQYGVSYDSSLVVLRYEEVLDSVEVLGSKYFVEKLSYVETTDEQFEVRQNDTLLKIPLNPVKGVVKFDPPSLKVEVDVEPLQNYELPVPIKCKNCPKEVDVKLFPAMAAVEFSCTAEDLKFISANDFSLHVKASRMDAKSDKLLIYLERYPSEAKNIRVSPSRVEYIIRKHD